MSSKKVNWTEMDKRILNRRAVWTSDERNAVTESLKKLPDAADGAEALGLDQPAVGGGADDDDDDSN
ncbi:MAG: hypothetical protein FJ095_00800 [Deltaproteobacteria bacterium]|nr:hypothetical protein [Deltaproteobacteria bacterium]